MKLLEFTEVDGKKSYINPEGIVRVMHAVEHGNCCDIALVNGMTSTVRGDLEAIATQIEEG